MSESSSKPWLTVIGIGEDGFEELSALARSVIADADYLFGGERHLNMVPEMSAPHAKRYKWPSPFSSVYAQLRGLQGKNVVVLASGDPMYCGIGGTLSRMFEAREMQIIPAPGAFSLAAARMRWPLDQCEKLTIHGRDIRNLLVHFQPKARLIILSKDKTSPLALAHLLQEAGADWARVTVLEHMGGASERTTSFVPEALIAFPSEFNDLNVMAVQMPDQFDGWRPHTPGLPDDAFLHDGKMTKQDIRASALAKLSPMPHGLLWDIGCGCGSVAIEWLRAHASSRAIGIEPLEKRRHFARHNADSLGVPNLQLVAGRVPEALEGLDDPDAIFIGGGLSEDIITICVDRLKPGGRLVAHAVTLGSEQCLLSAFGMHGGDLTRISISKAEPVGPFHGWKSAMPVTQWVYKKSHNIDEVTE